MRTPGNDADFLKKGPKLTTDRSRGERALI